MAHFPFCPSRYLEYRQLRQGHCRFLLEQSDYLTLVWSRTQTPLMINSCFHQTPPPPLISNNVLIICVGLSLSLSPLSFHPGAGSVAWCSVCVCVCVSQRR